MANLTYEESIETIHIEYLHYRLMIVIIKSPFQIFQDIPRISQIHLE